MSCGPAEEPAAPTKSALRYTAPGRHNKGRQLHCLVGQRASTIHLATVPDLEDFDHPPLIIYRIDDSVGTLANAVVFSFPGEFLAPVRTRGLREALDSSHDPGTNRPRLHRLELFGSRRLDEDAIVCHAAEES